MRRSSRDRRVAVIGAGPHGLAAAAHLRAAGQKTVIFGDVMEFWRENMPAGMLLRSALRASSIASPHRGASLEAWGADVGREPQFPLPLNDFREYAAWYQRRLVPNVDPRRVDEVRGEGGGFVLRLEDGEELPVDLVAVAAGIAPFPRIPPELASLPKELVSHSSQHRDLSTFSGQRLAVLGSGQSALESAALLHESGAQVEVIFRASAVNWLTGPTPPGKARRRRLYLPSAPTDICGPRSSWLTAAPDLYRSYPSRLRQRLSGCAGPAGGHWLRDRVTGIACSPERTIAAAAARNGGLQLELNDGSERHVDHLLLGTGYQVDVRRYSFLSDELCAQIDVMNGHPVLGPGLESTVRGLHFLGAPAAVTFGPVMRFVTGTWYTAPALTSRVLQQRRARPVQWAF